MKSHNSPTRAQLILDRAEELLAAAPMAQLLRFISPEALAEVPKDPVEGPPFSPASVRYHFGAEGRKFSHAKVATALVERMLKGNRQAAQVAAASYRYAANGVHDFADADK